MGEEKAHTQKSPTISEEPESLTTATENCRTEKIFSLPLHDYNFIIIPYISTTTTSSKVVLSLGWHKECFYSSQGNFLNSKYFSR